MDSKKNIADLVSVTDSALGSDVSSPVRVEVDVDVVVGAKKHQKMFWLFVIIAILVLLIIFFIAWGGFCCKGGFSYWNALNNPGWGNCPMAWAIALTIGIILFAWACAQAWVHCMVRGNKQRAGLVMLGFIVSMILLILWVYFFFARDGERRCAPCGLWTAVWLAVITFIVGLFMLWGVWVAGPGPIIATIIYLVVILVALIFTWQMADCNQGKCCDKSIECR